ncbi:hypothetical protein [Chitinilyticum piscinae]|uniref:Molecular chaperone n=1 Tax=Chitinilyticum piscinae TaxID=2866724 RepID=A0A8J7FJF7_9NEIS|nr:hypothetical protein [Chitinilyticum piscinae]MBE9608972.1 hypothetical protein [Chitinilyticum piscinae]
MSLSPRAIQPDSGSPAPFADARAAREWLKLLPLINTPLAHSDLRQALEQMNQSSLAALEKLKILEQFRETIHLVQDDWMRALLAKPLPLNPVEHQQWLQLVQLWELTSDGYATCWLAAIEEDAGVLQYRALLAERTLYYGVRILHAHALAYQAQPEHYWQRLFAHYSWARQLGDATERVRDSLCQATSGVSNVESLFIQALLFSAGNPQQLSQRQQQWLYPVLELLAPRTRLGSDAPGLNQFAPLRIDLDQPAAPQRRPNLPQGAGSLAIDTLALAQTLSKRIKLLRQGEAPAQLGLGNGLSGEACESLLRDLYRHWCEQPAERKLPRKEQQSHLELAGAGLTNQHRWIARGRYAPPPIKQQTVYGNRDVLDIQMFGQTTRKLVAPVLAEAEREEWQLVDETALGVRLQRPLGGQRLQLQQLLTLRLGEQLLCGSVRWLEICADSITIGIRLLPGVPSPAAARTIEAVRLGQEAFTEVLLLPAMAALKEPNSLLQPPGWFRQGRVIELWDGSKLHKLRMQKVIERGCDFERVHIVPAGSTGT